MSLVANDNSTAMADQRLQPLRLQPLVALRALSRLLKNKEDTEQVFIIMRALSGRSTSKGYARLLKTAKGGRIAYRREELAKTLSDTEFLKRLPAGSLGAAYLHFTTTENISAQGLIDESRKVEDERDIDREHPVAWYGRRLRDIHDLWHVLTGYGRDGMGEACLVAFSFAQTRSPGFGLMGLAGALKLKREVPNQPMLKAVWQAYQNGRKAAWLPGEDYVALLSEPLESARARLNIAKPSRYQAMPAEIRANGMAPAMAA
jgi:ubiquinone biosynthesis protein COQ4